MAKYKEWLQDDNLILLNGWARDGLTDEIIASRMGIGLRTYYEWKEKYPQFAQAIKKGKEVVDYAVESALLKRALSGDTTAQIFWLKNRKPKQWRDRPEEPADLEAIKVAAELLKGVPDAYSKTE